MTIILSKLNTVITGVVIIFSVCFVVLLAKVSSVESKKEDTSSRTTTVYAQSIPYETIEIPSSSVNMANSNEEIIQSFNISRISDEDKSQAKEEINEAVKKVTPKKKKTSIAKSAETVAKVVDTTSNVIKEAKEDVGISAEENRSKVPVTLTMASDNYSDEEIDILCRIVQAEAGGEDIIGKVLVANVVLNRVNSPLFKQGTIKEVVFANGQFEPVSTGRYYKVEVTSETKEAVQRALKGEDYSKGALYFHATYINPDWSYLKKIFTYGGHVFYKPRG